MSIYKLGEKMLSISVIAEIIAEGKQLALGSKAKKKTKDCRNYLDKKMEQSDTPIYGINTGFGALCNHKITNKDLGTLQKNLVLSHACGTSLESSNMELLQEKFVQGITMIYVCENKACQLPTTNIMQAQKLMK